MKKNYLLNIHTGKIHSGLHPCTRTKKMATASKKYFEKYEDAESFFEGKARKGVPCTYCFPEKQ